MPKFAANLSLMFTEWSFLDRFAAAADAGFDAVEFQFPYPHGADEIAGRLAARGQTCVLFNLPPGDLAAGDRGLAALPERAEEFRASVARARDYARVVGAPRLHLMAGVADPRDPRARAAYADALRHAVDVLGPEGVDVLIEPLNARDNPGYFLADFDAAASWIGELARERLKLQYDIYHRQILHGDVLASLEAMLPIVGHVQTASVPGRNEPMTGELNDEMIFERLDALGYAGYVGCEYRPAAGTLAGLGWFGRSRDKARKQA